VKRPVEGIATIFEDREGTKLRLVGAAGDQIGKAIRPHGPAPTSDPIMPLAQNFGVSTFAPAGGSTGVQSVPAMITSLPGAPTVAPSIVAPSFAPPPAHSYAPPVSPVMPAAMPRLLPDPGFGSALVAARDPEADMDRTMARSSLSGLRPGGGTQVVLPDGRTFAIGLGEGLVIGRSPIVDPALPSAALVTVADPSLSKTHATIGKDDTGVWLVDHHSTNGSSVSTNGTTQACQSGLRVTLTHDAQLVLGEVLVRLVIA
jgi:FHA domain